MLKDAEWNVEFTLLFKSGEWKCYKRAEPLLCHAPNACAELVKEKCPDYY